MNMFSKKVSEIISFSKEEAERLNSPNLTPEHLLLGILRDKDNSVKSMMKDDSSGGGQIYVSPLKEMHSKATRCIAPVTNTPAIVE